MSETETAEHVDLTLRCPTCGERADMCFDHGDEWKKREHHATLGELYRMTEHELRAAVNEFTQDDPPPYAALASARPAFTRTRTGAQQ